MAHVAIFSFQEDETDIPNWFHCGSELNQGAINEELLRMSM